MMALPVDERLLTAQYYLIKQKEVLIARKRELYQKFREYALNKLKAQGKPFQVKFRAINGDSKIKFKELEMGEEFFLQYGKFIFDPKTNMITNYIRSEFRGTKTDEDVNKLMTEAKKQLHRFGRIQQTMALSSDLEIAKINEKMQQKVDEILAGIFKGELSFNDPAFNTLVEMNIALEKELQELNTRIAAVSIVTGSSDLDIVDNDNKTMENESSNNRMAMVEFLKENLRMGADPSLAAVALNQQDDVKTM